MNIKVHLIFALVLCGCPQPQPPTTDSGDAALYGDAPNAAVAICENLDEVGCPVGKDPHCVAVVAHVIDAGLTKVDVPCLTRATTRAAVRACGGFAECP